MHPPLLGRVPDNRELKHGLVVSEEEWLKVFLPKLADRLDIQQRTLPPLPSPEDRRIRKGKGKKAALAWSFSPSTVARAVERVTDTKMNPFSWGRPAPKRGTLEPEPDPRHFQLNSDAEWKQRLKHGDEGRSDLFIICHIYGSRTKNKTVFKEHLPQARDDAIKSLQTVYDAARVEDTDILARVRSRPAGTVDAVQEPLSERHSLTRVYEAPPNAVAGPSRLRDRSPPGAAEFEEEEYGEQDDNFWTGGGSPLGLDNALSGAGTDRSAPDMLGLSSGLPPPPPLYRPPWDDPEHNVVYRQHSSSTQYTLPSRQPSSSDYEFGADDFRGPSAQRSRPGRTLSMVASPPPPDRLPLSSPAGSGVGVSPLSPIQVPRGWTLSPSPSPSSSLAQSSLARPQAPMRPPARRRQLLSDPNLPLGELHIPGLLSSGGTTSPDLGAGAIRDGLHGSSRSSVQMDRSSTPRLKAVGTEDPDDERMSSAGQRSSNVSMAYADSRTNLEEPQQFTRRLGSSLSHSPPPSDDGSEEVEATAEDGAPSPLQTFLQSDPADPTLSTLSPDKGVRPLSQSEIALGFWDWAANTGHFGFAPLDHGEESIRKAGAGTKRMIWWQQLRSARAAERDQGTAEQETEQLWTREVPEKIESSSKILFPVMTKFVAVDEVTGDVAEVEDEAGKWKSDAMMLVGARWSGQRGEKYLEREMWKTRMMNSFFDGAAARVFAIYSRHEEGHVALDRRVHLQPTFALVERLGENLPSLIDGVEDPNSVLRVLSESSVFLSMARSVNALHRFSDFCHGRLHPSRFLLRDIDDPARAVGLVGIYYSSMEGNRLQPVRDVPFSRLHYISPQDLTGPTNEVSARNKSDVFALGICMLSLAWAKAEPTLSSDRPMELAFPALQRLTDHDMREGTPALHNFFASDPALRNPILPPLPPNEGWPNGLSLLLESMVRVRESERPHSSQVVASLASIYDFL